jgi:hypothetical protein
MNYEILCWILIISLIIIAIVIFAEIRNPNSKIVKNKTKGETRLKHIRVLIVLLYIFINIPFIGRYDLYYDKKTFTKYKTPQVDSTMYLSSISKDRKIYYPLNNNSIHTRYKRVDYDLFTIDKITDDFYNRKIDISLKMVFTKSSIFRKEKRTYQLIRVDRGQDIVIDNLNENRKDSVLKSWGYTEQLYKEDNRH